MELVFLLPLLLLLFGLLVLAFALAPPLHSTLPSLCLGFVCWRLCCLRSAREGRPIAKCGWISCS